LVVVHILEDPKKIWSYGDVLNCVVRGASSIGTVKDSQLVKVVLVRTRKERRRADGSYIRFSDNAGVVIDTAADKIDRNQSFGLLPEK